MIIEKEKLNRQLNNVLGDDIKNKIINSGKTIVNSYSKRFRNSDIMRNNSLSKNKKILNKTKIINIKNNSIFNSTSKDKNKNKTKINIHQKLYQHYNDNMKRPKTGRLLINSSSFSFLV